MPSSRGDSFVLGCSQCSRRAPSFSAALSVFSWCSPHSRAFSACSHGALPCSRASSVCSRGARLVPGVPVVTLNITHTMSLLSPPSGLLAPTSFAPFKYPAAGYHPAFSHTGFSLNLPPGSPSLLSPFLAFNPRSFLRLRGSPSLCFLRPCSLMVTQGDMEI